MRWPSGANAATFFLARQTRSGRGEIREGVAAYRHRDLGQFDRGCPACRGVRHRKGRPPSFVGTFAYTSGPAYGVLLDNLLPGWPTGSCHVGLTRLAQPLPPRCNRRRMLAVASTGYDASTLRIAEEERDRAQQAPSRYCGVGAVTQSQVIQGIVTSARCARLRSSRRPCPAPTGVFRGSSGSTSFSRYQTAEIVAVCVLTGRTGQARNAGRVQLSRSLVASTVRVVDFGWSRADNPLRGLEWTDRQDGGTGTTVRLLTSRPTGASSRLLKK